MKQVATLFIPLLIVVPGLTLSGTEPLAPKPPLKTIPLVENTTVTPKKDVLPVDSLYQLLAAEMALDRDHPEIALANYIAAAEETQDADVAARATQVALSAGSLETAVAPAIIWANAAKNNLEAQITTAALYIRLGKIEKAVPFLLHAEEVNQEEAFQYYLILFRQLQKPEDNQRVISALEMLAAKETNIPSGHLALAEIYLFQGKDAKALDLSQKALKMDPNSTIGIQLFTETMLRKDKPAAKAFLDKHAQAQKQNSLLQQYYTQFLLENGFIEQAHQQIKELINNTKLTNEELLQLARTSIQAQWFDIAEKILKQTSKDDESKDLSHYFLARIAEMQNKEEVAIDWFKQVLTGPFHVLSQVRASVLLCEKKRYDEALEVLTRTQPSDAAEKKQIILATIEIYNQTHRYPEALVLLNDSLANMPNEIDLLYARSLIADRLDKIDLAETDLKEILLIQPSHLDALNALGYMLANKTKRFDEAQQYLSYALKLSPNNASVLDSLGWLYFKQGDYNKSLDTLKKAAQIMPDAEIAAHLGEVMWYLKDFDGAKRVWNNALEMHPKHDHVIKVMNRLIPNKE
ncbi:MAG: tetratricopeptide repeat protein [Proteobacteria bacterium]|nr:tetratricopeptide repeat protein [Pseudomonadota bacterium]